MALTLEDHQRALAKAQAAGDASAIAAITKRIDSYKHVNAFDKASDANDIGAADEIANRYRQSRPQEGPGAWSRDSARQDPMWIKNAKAVHKDATGKDFKGTDEEAADWLLSYMSDFNYRIIGLEGDKGTGLANIAFKVKDFSPKGKSAFIAGMEDFDALPVSWEGTGALAGRAVTDPSTYIGLGTFGAGTVAAQGAKQAAKESLKAAIKYGVKQTVKSAAVGAIEGGIAGAAQETLREKAQIGANRRTDYDTGKIGETAKLTAGVGAIGGTLTRALPAGRAAGAGGTILNKLPVEDQAAAGRVAKELEDGGFNLKKVTGQTNGASAALDQLHNANQERITSYSNIIRHKIDPRKAEDAADEAVRVAANEAIRAGRSKNVVSTPEGIDALEQLVGDTSQGRQLIDTLKEQNELVPFHKEGVKGGVSKYTDLINPFSFESRKTPLGPVAAATAAGTSIHLGFGAHVAPIALGAYAGGRAIDNTVIGTGRRALLNLYKKQNLKHFADPDYSGLTSGAADKSDKSLSAAFVAAQSKATEKTQIDRILMSMGGKSKYNKFVNSVSAEPKLGVGVKKAERTVKSAVRNRELYEAGKKELIAKQGRAREEFAKYHDKDVAAAGSMALSEMIVATNNHPARLAAYSRAMASAKTEADRAFIRNHLYELAIHYTHRKPK